MSSPSSSSMFSEQKIRNEAKELAPVVAGGFLASWISPYAKQAMHNVVNFVVNKGNYHLVEAPWDFVNESDEQKNDDGENTIKAYARWHITYDEKDSPLTAYVYTQRGFFQISLSSASILKAFPENNPKLSPNILVIYSDMKRKRNSDPTEDEKKKMEKVYWLCLVNMILRDLELILNSSSKKLQVPEFFKELMNILHDLYANGLHAEISKINESIESIHLDSWKPIRNFLKKNSYRIKYDLKQNTFYKIKSDDKSEENKNEIRSTYSLGMVFRYSISKFVLYMSNQNFQDSGLSESVLKTGQWAKCFSLHYDVLGCD